MAGRRSHPRFAVATPWDGSVRVLRDVIIQRTGPRELVAVSHAPGMTDEELSLEVMGGGASVKLRVRVIDSAPMVFQGAVRHRIRLAMIDGLDEAVAQGRQASTTPAPAEM